MQKFKDKKNLLHRHRRHRLRRKKKTLHLRGIDIHIQEIKRELNRTPSANFSFFPSRGIKFKVP